MNGVRFLKSFVFRAAGFFAVAVLLITSAIVHAEDKIALVVGNNAYDKGGVFPVLNNCASDAKLIGETLGRMGFDVISAQDASRTVMVEKLVEFESKLKPGCTAVFYFAGHGIEFQGKNYLMGVNAQLLSHSLLGEESMDAETFATAMLSANAKASFLFLDCCREAPPASWLTRGLKRGEKKRGLAEVPADGDIIIAYAAKPGQSALDGEGGHSPYAAALAHWLPQGLKYQDLFEKVRLDVATATKREQRTWENGSFLDPFIFPNAPGAALARLEPPKTIFPTGPATPSTPPTLAPAYRGTITVKGDPSSKKRPLAISLDADFNSGLMTQSNGDGEVVARFNGIWEGKLLRAVTSKPISNTTTQEWNPESFTLRFSDDGKTSHYECETTKKTYVAELTSGSPVRATPAQVYKGMIHAENNPNYPEIPLTIKFDADRKSGAMTQANPRGDLVVKFSGIWDDTTFRGATHKVVSNPSTLPWIDEHFSLRLSEDGTVEYENRTARNTYTAKLAPQ